ncbi:MAG: ABC transporter ATP-binding protein [Pseudomonadota bacterium]|nr:ABC transporter ATP-binding protein [Pseudomonadota bacterium]
MNPAIRIANLTFRYATPPVIDRVDLEVQKGEFLGLVGPNGGGKSTLLKIILGLLEPESGTVEVLGKPPRSGREAIGYVPQFAAFRRDFPISVEDTVLLGRLGKSGIMGPFGRRDRSIARVAMNEARIADLADRPIETLSGGQLQRTLVARALACEPEILLLDEPTANIDQRGEEDIFDLFESLNKRLTIVLVSHDIAFISKYVHRVACLNQTLVCHRTENINGELISELYGEPMRMIHHTHA